MQLQDYFIMILESDSIFDLAKNLEVLLNYIKSIKSKHVIFKELFRQLSVSAFYMKSETYLGYQIYTPKGSVLLFLLNYWNLVSSAKKNSSMIEGIIQKIRLEFFESENASYLNDEIFNMLRLTEEKLKYSGRVLRDSKIKVLNLDCTHHEWNCYYSATLQSEKEMIDDCIIMTQLPEGCLSSREFGFLHELGHLLHTRLTIQLSTVPKSFDNIIETFSSNISKNAKAELFADLFVSAALYGTPYEDRDHLGIDDSMKPILLHYFKRLIQENFPMNSD